MTLRLIYVTVFHPSGAREQFLEPEVRTLVSRGHDVLVVPMRPTSAASPTSADVASVRPWAPACIAAAFAEAMRRPTAVARCLHVLVQTTPRNVLRNLAIVPKGLWLARLARRWKADHIHVQWATTPASAALIASELSRIPWSLTVHRHDVLAANLLAVKASHASFVRFPSQAALDDAARVDPAFPLARSRLAHMGVAVPPSTQRPANDHPLVVLCPAALTARKGQTTLLRALQLLPDVPIGVWLAGDGEDRTQLALLADELGITDRIRFLGQVPHEELLDLYRTGKVWAVALPTTHEGIPFALIEAMAHGVPVVSTPVGGIPELLEGSAGRVVPVGDARALAEALQELCDDPIACEAQAARGRQRVMDSFDLEATVTTLEALLSSAAGQPRGDQLR